MTVDIEGEKKRERKRERERENTLSTHSVSVRLFSFRELRDNNITALPEDLLYNTTTLFTL
jgi:hypothetical protein